MIRNVHIELHVLINVLLWEQCNLTSCYVNEISERLFAAQMLITIFATINSIPRFSFRISMSDASLVS